MRHWEASRGAFVAREDQSFEVTLAAAQRGESWAFERLYRDLSPVVLGYLAGHGARSPEDVAAEAFVSIVRTIRRFRGDERQFRSWVFTIVHSRLLDERRRMARRRDHPTAPEDMPVVSSIDLTDEAAIAHVDRKVASLLDRLTDDQRSVLLLRVIADLSLAETAAVMQRRVGAVKALQSRALARLRRELERNGESRETVSRGVDR